MVGVNIDLERGTGAFCRLDDCVDVELDFRSRIN
jgi:hypothetical protein